MTTNVADGRTVDVIMGELMFGGLQDPFPQYNELRELGDGVNPTELLGGHMIGTYAETKELASRPDIFSNDTFAAAPPGIHNPDDPEHRRFIKTASQQFMFSDPPKHTRVRSTFRHAFTADYVRRNWRTVVEEVTDEVLARYRPGQEIDLMPELAAGVPVAVIARILGVPREVEAKFREWSFAYASTFDLLVQDERRNEAILTSLELFDYLAGLIAERRAAPADDLLSHMISTETIDGTHLGDDELLASAALLLVAGNETTTNLVGNGLTLLLNHPDALAALVADPARIPLAIEEMLRFDPPLHFNGRKVNQDVELGGRQLKAGTLAYVCLPAVNRDPLEFDDPQTFDITRTPNRHLTFFHGIHYCVGAPLARLEGQIIFERLLRAFPNIAPGNEPAVRRTTNINARGWEKRPVRL